MSRHATVRGTTCMQIIRFIANLLLTSFLNGVHAKQVWVCLHKLGVLGTMQLCTLRNDCVYRGFGPTMRVLIVHGSFQAFFVLVAAKRDVTQLEHHIKWMPERTCARFCRKDVRCNLNIRTAMSKSDDHELDTGSRCRTRCWIGL